MGDMNQYSFVRRMADQLRGPYLEVGSKDYGSTQDLRSLFCGRGRYVGVDLEDGAGVDVVVDLTRELDEIDIALEGVRFGTIFCLSVLEHCDQPFKMAENLTRLLQDGGRICISVPFAWKFHGYPSDYWRFTHEGVKKLFPEMHFDLSVGAAASSRRNAFSPLDEHIGKIPFSGKAHRRQGYFLRGLSAGTLRWLSRAGLLRWLAGHRYVLAPTNVFMIGVRRTTASRAA